MAECPRIVLMPHANLQYCQLAPERRGWVVEHAYRALFDWVESRGYVLAFEASGWTVDAIARLSPPVMQQLRRLVRSGQIEPVGSPYIHLMLANMDPELGRVALKDGLDAWEKQTGVRPVVGWNPECSWSDHVPEIFHQVGFESMVMDGDSYFLALPNVRKATGLSYDVRGHSNKSQLFKIDPVLQQHPELLAYITNPSHAENGLKFLFRTDILANPMLWYLMGATEGVRQQPVTRDDIAQLLTIWRDRVKQTGSFIMPFAEDAEYIGTTAYFYVKQFQQARFFEPSPDSVQRFKDILELVKLTGFELATPSQVIQRAARLLPAAHLHQLDQGIAWHGGTARAWQNTPWARILDPVCRTLWDNYRRLTQRLGLAVENQDPHFHAALRRLCSAWVSDARWPPAPTSPGRFNVREALDDLYEVNRLLGQAMMAHGLADHHALHAPDLMQTQIQAIDEELSAMSYFEEQQLFRKPEDFRATSSNVSSCSAVLGT